MVDTVNKVSESWFDTDSNDFKSGSKTVVEWSSTACHAPSAQTEDGTVLVVQCVLSEHVDVASTGRFEIDLFEAVDSDDVQSKTACEYTESTEGHTGKHSQTEYDGDSDGTIDMSTCTIECAVEACCSHQLDPLSFIPVETCCAAQDERDEDTGKTDFREDNFIVGETEEEIELVDDVVGEGDQVRAAPLIVIKWSCQPSLKNQRNLLSLLKLPLLFKVKLNGVRSIRLRWLGLVVTVKVGPLYVVIGTCVRVLVLRVVCLI